MLQLDTLFPKSKKAGRPSTMSRPHSETDFNDLELQEAVIENMDAETFNEKFEEMLVWKLKLVYCIVNILA